MQTVYIASNPLDLSKWEKFECEDIRALLVERFPQWPPTAHIYHQVCARDHDVTPSDEASEERLGSLEGPFWVVVYPAWANIAAAVLIWAIAFVATKLLEDDTPKPREHVFVDGSPNNSLSDRSNSARLNQRIPDSFGTVRAVPDLLMAPYIVYESHKPVEYSYMCVGRGKLAPTDVRDGDTPITQILGASTVFYPPGEAPGGGTPSLLLGDMITDNVYNVYPVRAVNNNDLSPINSFYCYGSGLNTTANRNNLALKWVPMQFAYSGGLVGTINIPTNGDPENVKSRISAGDELQVIFGEVPVGLATKPDLSAGVNFGANPSLTGVGKPVVRGDLEPLVVLSVVTLSTQYVVVTVTVPSSLEFQWLRITPYSGGPGVANKNAIVCAQNRWLFGYKEGGIIDDAGIFIDDQFMEEIWMNFVAPRGIFLEDGSNRVTRQETIAWQIVPCDDTGIATGDPIEIGSTTLRGSMIGGETRATTVKISRATFGRCRLSVARTSFRIRQVDMDPTTDDFFRSIVVFQSFAENPSFNDPATPFGGNVVDDIQFANCYSMSAPTALNVSDVTTVHSRVMSNESAARVVERQLNCLATRAVNTWNGVSFSPPEDSQGFGENMLFHIMRDSFIGRRSSAEIDFAGIAASFQAVRDYFGSEDATRFSYTFDDSEMSFEETVSILCQACFITPYRLGRVIKCDPEIATDNSVLLFNHRNKIPNTEQRIETFGLVGDNDGVIQSYIDVNNGFDTFTPLSLFQSHPIVVSPLQSRVVGLRFKAQAMWHAYRQQAKQVWQTTSTVFEATQEAAIIALKQRILVADNTDPSTQDGEVVDISGLTVLLSQPYVLDGGSSYTLFLQHVDGSVEGIRISAGSTDREVTLGVAPSISLVTNPDVGVRTTYILVRDQEATGNAFLVTDKQAQDRMTYQISATNYSHMYYHADGLVLWIPVSTEIGGEELFDRSPAELTYAVDPSNVGSDVDRGAVYEGHTGDPGLEVDCVTFASLTRYTIVCWIKRNNTNPFPILVTQDGSRKQFFEVEAGVSNKLQAGHNNVVYVEMAGLSINQWYFVAVTYDDDDDSMILYLQGEQVDANIVPVPTRLLSGTLAFANSGGSIEGFAQGLRYYQRKMSATEIREMYQKEIRP